MVCSNCNKFNMSENKMCVYCGTKLEQNPGAVSLKSFAGGDFSQDVGFDGPEGNREVAGAAPEAVEENLQQERVDLVSDFGESFDGPQDIEITFEEDIDLVGIDITAEDEEGVKLSKKERVALRNTALIAVILAVLIDAILVVAMVVCFKGFASRIVNVKPQSSESRIDTDIKKSGEITAGGRRVVLPEELIEV